MEPASRAALVRLIAENLSVGKRGGIVYDAARFVKPPHEIFLREHWQSQGRLREVVGGRGSVCFLSIDHDEGLDEGSGEWVLRHYKRGGAMARLVQDRYFWMGADRTRAFREWRLLAQLRELHLPVPCPIAARYVRFGLTYTADLITASIPESRTLTQTLLQAPLQQAQWSAIGAIIARFHAHGVQHADLNAHNILLQSDATVWLLDFDRGRIRDRGAWEADVLARLHRSLQKLTRQQQGFQFGETQWEWLMAGMRGGLTVDG
jgi:3-deoxy-D-manno-octulosonic acid kinase